MTDDHDFKALVRARMRETGENYTTARTALRPPDAPGAPDPAPDPPPLPPSHDDTGYAAALAQQRALVARHFDGERLRRIPAKRKTRVAVLLHLLARFEPGRVYPEAQVNELLARAHEDVAWLRRELVDYRYLTREHGRYRVAEQPPVRVGFEAQEVPAWEAHWLPGFLAGRPDPAATPALQPPHDPSLP